MPRRRAPTPSQTAGPFFGFALPFHGDSDAVDAASSDAIRIEGQLLDGAGEAIRDGLVEVWQAEQFARCRTDAEGVFHFAVRKPPPARNADGRHEAPHLEMVVFARGLLRPLITRVYFPDEEDANGTDPVLALVEPKDRHTLIAERDGNVLRFDIRLQGNDETVFFAL
jgi:protocatechuate 3,4-dioxygenase alpha subunit